MLLIPGHTPYTGPVRVTGSEPGAVLPASYRYATADKGAGPFTVGPGFDRAGAIGPT